VTLKLAMTLDGKIATASGDSRWITSSASRMLVHQLRFESDVVMVGSGTVLQDDPTLNVRSEAKNSITRVLLDSRLRTVPRARLFEAKDPVLIYHHLPASQEALEGLSTRAELIRVSSIRQELDLTEVLSDLATRNLTSVLVEGGARVATSLIKESLANKLLLFYAPKLVGSAGISAFSLLGVERISKAPEFKVTSQRAIDGDILVELVPR
jgi:diaminohydroxyphosphoribosylaminopyrimidine deaminase/5-amino-6-(5-phosphoribosylamino)uracil reductase